MSVPQSTSEARNERPGFGPALPQLIALPIAGALIWLLARQLSDVDPTLVLSTLQQYPLGLWGLGIAASGLSFLAIGRYDALIHRRLRTGVRPPRAARAGMQAVAIGQVVGMGMVSGAITRWRALPELSALNAGKVSALMGFSFLAALAILCLVTALLGGFSLPFDMPSIVPIVGLPVVFAILVWTARNHRSGSDGFAILIWAALDTGFASLTIWVFLPPGIDPASFYAIYLLALGAGLLSNAPGGLGAFELTLIALLPQVPMAEMLSAILAHRICYYGLPALLALPGVIAARRPALSPLAPVRGTDIPAAHPDFTLHLQGARIMARGDRTQAWLARPAPFCLAALGAPHGPADFAGFALSANQLGRLPVHYKIGSALAAKARAAGYTVTKIAQEATLDPTIWTTDGPDKRQLRRKINQATRNGIDIRRLSNPLPLPELGRVNADWRSLHGPEKGFSMGQFSLELLSAQTVFGAYHDQRLVAFVSLNTLGDHWSLDLMRHGQSVPNGTMHALVCTAIGAARAQGVTHFSLAAIPDLYGPLQRIALKGLHQFKDSFAPTWQPLYAAAPGPAQLWLGLASIGFAVHHPHDDLEEFAFELRKTPCHGPADASDVTAQNCEPLNDQRPLPPA